jgi:hypothetical protein
MNDRLRLKSWAPVPQRHPRNLHGASLVFAVLGADPRIGSGFLLPRSARRRIVRERYADVVLCGFPQTCPLARSRSDAADGGVSP